jgi:hypothetical protein
MKLNLVINQHPSSGNPGCVEKIAILLMLKLHPEEEE